MKTPVSHMTGRFCASLFVASWLAAPLPAACAAFDKAAFAGTYHGTLPCADCEGIVTLLTFRPDGRYVLQQTYLKNGVHPQPKRRGRWTPSEDGRLVELDYDKRAPGGPFNCYGIVDATAIVPYDRNCKPIEKTTFDFTLKKTLR